MDRTPRARERQQQRVRAQVRSNDAQSFFNLLTDPDLLDEVESRLPPHRERLFPPTETLSMFLAQALNADRSCQQAVNNTALHRMANSYRHAAPIPARIAVPDNVCRRRW